MWYLQVQVALLWNQPLVARWIFRMWRQSCLSRHCRVLRTRMDFQCRNSCLEWAEALTCFALQSLLQQWLEAECSDLPAGAEQSAALSAGSRDVESMFQGDRVVSMRALSARKQPADPAQALRSSPSVSADVCEIRQQNLILGLQQQPGPEDQRASEGSAISV